jgi:DNA-binding NarL/FixJ family response regulator
VPQVGDFLAVGAPLFRLYGPGASTLDERALRDGVALGIERTMEQDPAFGFRIVVDIASKALSPAINGPTTGVLAVTTSCSASFPPSGRRPCVARSSSWRPPWRRPGRTRPTAPSPAPAISRASGVGRRAADPGARGGRASGGRVATGDNRPVSQPRRPRVLLADDHRLVAEGLKSLLAPDFDLVDVVEDGRALVEAVRRLRPDVVVADVAMPQLNGIEALVQLRQEGDRVPVVFLTMHRDVAYARRALDAGASGFVLKHSAPAELVTAIRAALDGKTYLTPQLAGEVLEAMKEGPERAADPVASLTPRQRQVLQLLAEGRSAKEIAARLSISARTVEFHKYQVMETLGLHTNAELTHFAIKHGLVEL